MSNNELAGNTNGNGFARRTRLGNRMLKHLASALMQPVSDGSLAGCIHDFAKVLMLLFVLQLSAAAMYLMLIAQLIAVSGFTMMLR